MVHGKLRRVYIVNGSRLMPLRLTEFDHSNDLDNSHPDNPNSSLISARSSL